MEKNVVVKTATVSELGNAIKLKTVDAVIIWDSIAALYADCGTVIGIPEAENELSKIPAAVLAVSPDKKEAGKFVLFLGSDEGRRILKKHHYNVPGGRRE